MNFPTPTLSELTKEKVVKPFIQGHVTEALHCALEHPSYAAPNLSRWFRNTRSLGSRDRRIVSEIVYTIIRFEDWFLKSECIDIHLHADSDLRGIFDWWMSSNEHPQFDFATHTSLPSSMAKEWCSRIEDPEAFAHHIQQRAPLDIRINAKRTTRKIVQRKLKHQGIISQIIPQTSFGLRITGTQNIHQTGVFQQGLVEIQDAASQLFIERLAPLISSKTTILDFCAGAGGKALAFAALGAKVTVHEPRSNAVEELKRREKRAGTKFRHKLPDEPVDILIVDAPCSGTGRLRREPTLRWKWKEQPISVWPKLQFEILQKSLQYVKKDGLIVYATCSMMNAENQHCLEGWDAERKTIWGHTNTCDGFSWTIFKPEST